MDIDHERLTQDEIHAIYRLRDAIEQMPDSLWLFSNGELHVMKGEQPADQDDVVATIKDIRSDGGGF